MRPVTMHPWTPRSRIRSTADNTRGRSSSSSPSNVPSRSKATSLYFTRVTLRYRFTLRYRSARDEAQRRLCVLRQPFKFGERGQLPCVVTHPLFAVLHDAERTHEVV